MCMLSIECIQTMQCSNGDQLGSIGHNTGILLSTIFQLMHIIQTLLVIVLACYYQVGVVCAHVHFSNYDQVILTIIQYGDADVGSYSIFYRSFLQMMSHPFASLNYFLVVISKLIIFQLLVYVFYIEQCCRFGRRGVRIENDSWGEGIGLLCCLWLLMIMRLTNHVI